jgi:ribosomal protein S18 acetylase RimI-like enzyme
MVHMILPLSILIVSMINSIAAFTSVLSKVHNFRHLSNNRSTPSIHLSSNLYVASNAEVSQVQSNADIIALADLRYKEWIQDQTDASTEGTNIGTAPSQHSFRLATAEIFHERKAEGATVFLARYKDDAGDETVGAAELSPIETRDCIQSNLQLESSSPIAMYATDVVASRSHRRLGIGSKLMNALEDTAWGLGCRYVFLHVEYVNTAAIGFYHRLGYLNVLADGVGEDSGVVSLSFTNDGLVVSAMQKRNDYTADINACNYALISVDMQQLATNAGTDGQLLMVKQLQESRDSNRLNGNVMISNSATKSASGFGTKAGGSSKKKKGKRKSS